MIGRPTRRKVSAAFGRRVYEYHDDEGNVYYSFSKAPSSISPTKRLYLQSRLGTHVINFLVKLRAVSEALQEDDG